MSRASLPAVSLGVSLSLLIAACSDLPPGQPGVFANGADVGGQMARAATVTSAESMATGSTAGTVAAAGIVILAKHQATPQQQRVAKRNARTAVAKLRSRAAKASTPPTSAMSKKTGEPAPAHVPRYIAVDTAKDASTAPHAAKAVVIFDTVTEEIVGNNVYDVKSTPPVGDTAKFDTVTAEYVGSGS